MDRSAEKKKELFERMSVPKALATLAIPTIVSQLITMIYNLADTYFIGQTDDPYKVAAATLSFVLVFAMNALSNLFGVGGGTLISRLLGKGRQEEAKNVAAFSFYGAFAVAALYSLCCFFFMPQVLSALGASENTYGFAADYAFWVVVVGGIPAALSMTLAHFLRSEGYAKESGFGLSMGGVLNILLDPLFMFVLLPEGHEVEGAGIATMLSNVISMLYFFLVLGRLKKKSVISLSPKRIGQGKGFFADVMGTGIPSAMGAGLACLSNLFLNQFTSGYGDIELAALGIVKKIDMLPLNVGMGLCQGMLPLVAYNYAAGNGQRMKKVISVCRLSGLIFSLSCVFLFEIFAHSIVSFFISDVQTVELGTSFLRICCLATPLMFCNLLATFSIQAMGKAKESLILSVCRQGLVNIPLMYGMNALFQMYGLVWTQFFADSITILLSAYLLHRVMKPFHENRT